MLRWKKKHLGVDEPLITAVVNNYNYARYLHNAIGSVFRQTYKNIELIVVDDGSTDHSREIIASYGDKLRPILTENGGQGHAVNLAVAAANGEYVAFLDSDDFWVPAKIQKMVELARQRPDAGLLYHRYLNTNVYGDAMGGPEPPILLPASFQRGYLHSGGSYWHSVMSTLMLKRDLLQKIVPIPTYANREGADSVLEHCGIMLSRIAAHPDAMAYRRIHGGNLYAAGRETYDRTPELRLADVKRVEWRSFCVRQILRRHGIDFKINLNANEWRMINLHQLGLATQGQVMLAAMRNSNYSYKERARRLRDYLRYDMRRKRA
ncbi:MAG: glycosyl transferase family 2 [Alphaproteobacteria bacterium]|nr:glycosyl transferase family 2 [Alphaproteobacteria bacterium]